MTDDLDDDLDDDEELRSRGGGWRRTIAWVLIAAFVLPLVLSAVQHIVD